MSRGYKIAKLIAIVDKLRSGFKLLPLDEDHTLSGEYDGCRGCHMHGDWCLIYKDEGSVLALVRTGTYADLFKDK